MLLAGDQNDEMTTAWVVAQDLMAAYANPDRPAGKNTADSSSPPYASARSVRSPASGAHSHRVEDGVPRPFDYPARARGVRDAANLNELFRSGEARLC